MIGLNFRPKFNEELLVYDIMIAGDYLYFVISYDYHKLRGTAIGLLKEDLGWRKRN